MSPTKTDGGSSGGGTPAMIMPQKKPMQNPHLAAQDGVRSDLLKAIRDGKCIEGRCKKRCNACTLNRGGGTGCSGCAKQEEANGVSSQTILARRVAVEMSDSDNKNASDSEYHFND